MRLRRKRLKVVDLDDLPRAAEPVAAPADEPEQQAAAAELRAVVAEGIGRLPFEYRAPLVLRDIEGLSNDEVAAVLGISTPAAKSRIHRARMRLREEVERWEQGSASPDS